MCWKVRWNVQRAIRQPILPLLSCFTSQNLRKAEKLAGKPKKPIKLQGVHHIEEMRQFSKMHITAGMRRGMRLLTPNVFLRPMMGKVREALFNTLNSMYVFKNKACSVSPDF